MTDRPAPERAPDEPVPAEPAPADPVPDEQAPPGAQPERTALAWRRTALAVAVGALVGGRVLEPWAGPLVWAGAAAGVLAAALLGRVGARRAAAWGAVLDTEVPGGAAPDAPGDARPPGGGALAATAAGTAVLGVVALLAVLLVG